MTSEPNAPLPITVITGFLGSGKTTLLNRLLSSPALADAAVLINEFGEIGLDHLLVRHADEELILLDSGCVCCTLRGDLVEQLGDLLDRRGASVPAFSRVVLETTGLADPAPIVQTLLTHPRLAERLYIDGVITTVDAQHALRTFEQHPESQKQVAVADRLLITKTDLVTAEQLARVEALLASHAPDVEQRHATLGEVNPSFILGLGHLDTRSIVEARGSAREPTHEHTSHQRIRSMAVTLEEPLDFPAFSLWVAMLTQLDGARIVRLKAVISARGESTPIAVQAVQHVVYPTLNLPPIRGLNGRSHIVVLTSGMQEHELAALRASLLALAEPQPRGA